MGPFSQITESEKHKDPGNQDPEEGSGGEEGFETFNARKNGAEKVKFKILIVAYSMLKTFYDIFKSMYPPTLGTNIRTLFCPGRKN